MAHLQTVALAAEFDLRWPGWLAGLFAASDAGSSVSDQVLSLDCVLPSAGAQVGAGASVFAGAALVLGTPLVCIVGAGLFWGAASRWSGARFVAGSGAGAAPEAKPGRLRAADAFRLTVIVLMSTLHASLSKATLRLLTCRSLGGRHWLAADMAVECWAADSPHSTVGLPLAIPALLLFVLGIPAGTAALLWRQRRELASPAVRAKYGFLYASYREDTFYWDSVVLLRKLAIAAVAVFLRPAGAGLQACTAQLVVFVSLQLQTRVQPYANAGVNTLDAYALLAEFATFFLAIVLYASGSDDNLKQAVSLGIGLVNVAYLAYFIFVFSRESPLVRSGASRLSAATACLRVRATSGALVASCCFRRTVSGAGEPKDSVELLRRPAQSGFGDGASTGDGNGAMVVNPLVSPLVSPARVYRIGSAAEPSTGAGGLPRPRGPSLAAAGPSTGAVGLPRPRQPSLAAAEPSTGAGGLPRPRQPSLGAHRGVAAPATDRRSLLPPL
jgi:hypothetical protein